MHERHCKHEIKCRKCERGKFVLGRDERKKKKCRPGKSRKQENMEKMGPNGCPGDP